MFYVEDDNWEKLKLETNRSKLINELLRDNFSKRESNQLTKEELEKKIAIAKIEIEAAKKAEEVINGNF